MIRTLNMNSQSSDVDGKGGEYLVVVLNVASKTAKQILVIFLFIFLFVDEYAPCPILSAAGSACHLFIIYLTFIIIYHLFIICEYAHCPTPPSPPLGLLVIYESRET